MAKLPFNGAKFTPVALVRSALCVTETHGAERAGYMQMQVLIPALLARLGVEVGAGVFFRFSASLFFIFPDFSAISHFSCPRFHFAFSCDFISHFF